MWANLACEGLGHFRPIHRTAPGVSWITKCWLAFTSQPSSNPAHMYLRLVRTYRSLRTTLIECRRWAAPGGRGAPKGWMESSSPCPTYLCCLRCWCCTPRAPGGGGVEPHRVDLTAGRAHRRVPAERKAGTDRRPEERGAAVSRLPTYLLLRWRGPAHGPGS
jgi:hypothetical protein